MANITELAAMESNARPLTVQEQKVLEILAAGATQVQAAHAVGLSESRISQMVADEDFSAQLAERRFLALAQAARRDGKYDRIEDSLLDRLETSLTLITRPMEVLKALDVINKAKRRSQEDSPQATQRAVLVNIVLPQHVAQMFTVSATNQVVQAGEQTLVTMQSGTLLKEVENKVKELPIIPGKPSVARDL